MAHAKRAEIICKKAALSDANGTASKMQLRKEIIQLSMELIKTTTNLEKFISVGQDFYEELKETTSLIPSDVAGRGNIFILQSVYQADTTIARACTRKKCDIAFMCDTDLAAYAGKCCVGVEDFRFTKGANKNSCTIADASIFSASKETIYSDICDSALHFPCLVKTKLAGQKEKKVPFIINAVYPLFDQVEDPQIRALYAVTAGCEWLRSCYGREKRRLLEGYVVLVHLLSRLG